MLISGGSKFNANTGSFLGAIQQSIQYILGIATAGIALGFTLWKTYLKKRIESFATKKDLEDITTIVETIQSDFAIQTQSKISIKSEERNALIDFYKKYSYWYQSISDIFFTEVDSSNYSETIPNIIGRLDKARFDCDMAKANYEIFLYDPFFELSFLNLYHDTQKLQGIVAKASIHLNLLEFKRNQFHERQKTQAKSIVDEYKVLLDERAEITKKLITERSDADNKMLDIRLAFRKDVQEKIAELFHGNS